MDAVGAFEIDIDPAAVAGDPDDPDAPAPGPAAGLHGLDPASIDAVSLDVGGVLVVPDHEILSRALTEAGVAHDRGRFLEGHYRGMAEVDRTRAEPEVFGDYQRAFLAAVGVPGAQLDRGAAALAVVLTPQVWHQPVPGALAAAHRLAAAGYRLAVTSNSDGTVEELLRRHELAQIGRGPGVPVEHVTDSGILGTAKPDPAMFLATADGLGLPPARILHVGDAGRFDADGAAAVGMVAVHVDPFRLCDEDHRHVPSLAVLADHLAGPPA
jgi:putative hydrolase of the HAD superfamily